MEYAVKYWEETADFEELRKQIGDRKIAVWGHILMEEMSGRF